MEKDRLTPSGFKVILVGGSAGSLEVLLKILPELNPQCKAAIIFILHRMNAGDETLEHLIALKTTIPVMEVEDKTRLAQGCLYLAPPDYHLLFEKNHVLSLDISEKVNYSRPSIDVSFESAAYAYGIDVTAILLSGANTDGTLGLNSVKEHGGTIVVQSPESAEVPFMPSHAIQKLQPEHVLDIDGITSFIKTICMGC